MKERRVEDHLARRVKATGGFTRKVTWPGHRGAPDRLCGWPHLKRHGLVELKRPGVPQAQLHQRREHNRLRSIGMRVDLLITIEDVDAYIAEMTA